MAGKTDFINSMSIIRKVNPVGFLDLTRIAATMIVDLHWPISVS